ncbi:MAG: mercury methylation corrinoid protein HgcA [Thermodesulfobacteriota bacterium]
MGDCCSKPSQLISIESICRPPEEKVQVSLPGLNQPFVIGSIQTPVGMVPQVSSSLIWKDHLGTFKSRWGVGRMHYSVEPGLYASGQPDEHAPVLVTANYKMSFDYLREAMLCRDVWILVLDTKGINVWCAAGKGTFGTRELVGRIKSSGIAGVVTHRQLILPQLAGPGVAAHQVNKLSGFKVIYGPIRAKDLPAFIDAGFKATPEMRCKTFTMWERAVLIPIELVSAFKPTLIALPILFLLGGLGGTEGFWANAFNSGLFAVLAFLSAVFAGSVLSPLLLPWLPGRAFAMKGLALGLLVGLILAAFRGGYLTGLSNRFEILAWMSIVSAVTAYLAMNFTGASTYTSLSGVKKEMRWAIPLEIGIGVVGIALWIGSRFIA